MPFCPACRRNVIALEEAHGICIDCIVGTKPINEAAERERLAEMLVTTVVQPDQKYDRRPEMLSIINTLFLGIIAAVALSAAAVWVALQPNAEERRQAEFEAAGEALEEALERLERYDAILGN